MNEQSSVETNYRQDFICKNCGAKLQFSPGTHSLTCEYCGAMNDIQTKNEEISELDLEQYIQDMTQSAPTINIVTVKCNSCGAQTTFDENIVSNFCSFCGSPIVINNATTQTIFKPKGLLPFRITRDKAMEAYSTWLSKIWWAPFDFKKKIHSNEKLSGVYIPYWTYDADTYSSYTGERGDDYTVMETYTTMENGRSVTRQRPVTHTRWTYVSGNVSHFFDDILVIASNSLPRAKTEKLEPWDLQNIEPFDEAFLSGFRTECYQIDLKDGVTYAKSRMEQYIETMIVQNIGGDHQRIRSVDTTYSNQTFKHILLPIWISAYRYENKPYRYLVNGRTGEVQGEYPVSALKIILTIAAVAAIIGFIIWMN